MFANLRNLYRSVTPYRVVFFILHIEALFAAGLSFYPLIDSLTISILCLIGLIPLAGTIADVTDWIIQRSSPIFAGLLNAAFGNFPELVFGLFSVANREYEFLLAIMYGSVLSNMLLAMGLTIIISQTSAHQNSIEKYHSVHRSGSKALFFATSAYMLSYFNKLANGVPCRTLDIALSVILILVYIYNNIYTFSIVRQIENKNSSLIPGSFKFNVNDYLSPFTNIGTKFRGLKLRKSNHPVELNALSGDDDAAAIIATDLNNVVIDLENQNAEIEYQIVEKPVSTGVGILQTFKVVHTWFWIIVTLLYATLISALITNGITQQIADLSNGWGLSPRFIGGVLVATVGNLCEYWSALVFAKNGDIDTGLQISLSSSLQILMFLLPLFVLGTVYESDFLYMGADAIFVMPLFLTSIIIPFTLFPTTLDMYGGVGLVSLYAMIAVLFYVN